MIKLISLTIVCSLFASCTTVETQVTQGENDSIIMTSTEDSIFSSPKEKLKFVLEPEAGGRIKAIYREGKPVADQFAEEYPNKEMDFKKLNSRILDDGSGLIIVDSKIRDKYQLRRSYNLFYDKNFKKHIIEVIYNVKNYSSEEALSQQWIQQLSLPPGSDVIIKNQTLTSKSPNSTFTIEAINIQDLVITSENSKVKLGNKGSFKLGTKERLSWKVLYILSN